MPPFVRPISLPRPLFQPQARSRAVRLEIGGVDHHCLPVGALGRKPLHHPGENSHVAPALPSVVERLRSTILHGRIGPTQAITIDEDYTAQDPPIVDPRFAMALWKERPQPRHLLVAQPERIAHHAPISLGACALPPENWTV